MPAELQPTLPAFKMATNSVPERLFNQSIKENLTSSVKGDGFEPALGLSGLFSSNSTHTASNLMVSTASRPAVQTVSDAAVQLKSGQTEIALSPEELGRVSIRMTQTDTGLVVLLTVERDETHALLRKHVTELADSLHAAGLGEAQIDFSDRRGQKMHDGGLHEGGDSAAEALPVATLELAERGTGSPGVADRIDIRM